MPSILFVCIHNACRSQIAETICRKLAPSSWMIASAGSNPSDQVDPKAVEILRKNQLAMDSIQPKGLAELPPMPWDYVVSMGCGNECPDVPARKFIEWEIPDPQDGPIGLYEALFDDLTNRIHKLIQEIEDSSK